MALRIFRRKPDEPDPNIPPPAVGVNQEGSKTGDGQAETPEGQWRPGGSMTQQVEDDAHGLAPVSRPRSSPRTTTRPKPTRSKAGKARKATGARRPAKRAKKASRRKTAAKRAKTAVPKRAKKGTRRTR